MNTYSVDKATTIRYPATANLMIDSKDRDATNYPSPWNFQIVKTQSIQNGFMTRVGTTEVVLEWYNPNISSEIGNNTIYFDVSGSAGLAINHLITIPDGFYNVAEVFNYIAQDLSDLSGTTGTAFKIVYAPSGLSEYSLEATNGALRVPQDTTLSQQLLLPSLVTVVPSYPLFQTIDLRLYRYLDFVCNQLTYNQDLKDNSTALYNRDVLCRWYMAYDNQVPNSGSVDQYGFPILMGYEPFVLRRLFNPPKQIKWDNNIPVGNLAFEVYGDNGQIVMPTVVAEDISQWLMTLQLSEN